MSRPREIAALVAVASLLLCDAGARAQTAPVSATLTAAQWQADLRYLAAQMPLRHKNLYHTMTPAAFAAAVAQLDADIPHLNGDEIALRLIALATLPTDSHTGAFGYPPGQSFPLRLRRYDDGIYVEAAPERYGAAVGGKLIAIGTTPANVIYDRLLTVIPHDTGNPGLQGLLAPVLMTMGPVLHGLNVAATAEAATYTIQKGGKRMTLDLTPSADTRALFGYAPLDAWVDARGRGAQPLWLQHPGETFWSRYDPAGGTYYIQFNAVADTPSQTIAQFFDTTFADVARVKPDKLVLDIRNNGGGNNYLLKPIIVGLIRLPEIDRPGHLFVITSRNTYSAAQNLVNRLEQYTDAVFVGTPTGQHVNSYGDPAQIKLPNSGLTVGMASVWWQDVRRTRQADGDGPRSRGGPDLRRLRRGTRPCDRRDSRVPARQHRRRSAGRRRVRRHRRRSRGLPRLRRRSCPPLPRPQHVGETCERNGLRTRRQARLQDRDRRLHRQRRGQPALGECARQPR